MARVYDLEGCLVTCPGCRRVSRWERTNVGVPIYQCACGEKAPDEYTGVTEEIYNGTRQPAVGDLDYQSSAPGWIPQAT